MRLAWTVVLALAFLGAVVPGWCASGDETESGQGGDLHVLMTADREAFRPGEEIHFLVQAVNRGSNPLRILYDSVFVGRTIKCTAADGESCPNEGGYATWSPKVGEFTGRTYLLQPGESQSFKMDALVDDRRQLIFSSSGESRESGSNLELKKKFDLPIDFPDKYISAGAIIRLAGPGKYRLAFVYSASEQDRQWHFAGAATPAEAAVDLLWIGTAVSDPVEIEIL